MTTAVNDSSHKTACILCSVNCGLEVEVNDGSFFKDPWRQKPRGFGRLHVSKGAASRLLPERKESGYQSTAKAPGRDL